MEKVITIEGYLGCIGLSYDSRGWLSGFDIRMAMTKEQYSWFIMNLPVELSKFDSFVSSVPKIKAYTVENAPSFETFYNRYGNKDARSEAVTAWLKLPTLFDQVLAVEMIPVYDAKRGIAAKKYPATYLNSRTYNIDLDYLIKKTK